MKPSAVRYLVFWLTTRCNLQCTYCYRPKEGPVTITRELIGKALELAAASGHPFHVQISGGEPTLEPELIRFTAALIRDAGWPATIALQTNGTHIDESLIRTCLHYQIEIGLSIDGPLIVQQRVRGHAQDTYRGLGTLAAARIPVWITSVLCAETAPSLTQLAMSLAAFPNVRGFGLDPLVQKGSALSRPQPRLDETVLQNLAAQLCNVLTLINRRRGDVLHWRELDRVHAEITERKCSPHYCHAERGECLAVHPNGAVFPCSQVMGERGYAAGTVDAVDWAKLEAAFAEARMPCSDLNCPLAGRCPGDCPSRLRFNGNETRPIMCTLYRAIAHQEAS